MILLHATDIVTSELYLRMMEHFSKACTTVSCYKVRLYHSL